jgi:hypothetical protein
MYTRLRRIRPYPAYFHFPHAARRRGGRRFFRRLLTNSFIEQGSKAAPEP